MSGLGPVAFGVASAKRTTHLWIRWAEAAIDSERLSIAAKNRRTPAELHPYLGAEFTQGTVAVCAAVFSMTALTRERPSQQSQPDGFSAT
jgi:hypothetical protein